VRTAQLIAFVAIVIFTRCAAAETVWIDSDVAIGSPIRDVDDAYALVFALHSRENRIAGISTSYGNASLTHSTGAARELVQQSGNHTAVFAGAASRRDLGKRTAATDALAGALKKHRLTYIAVGPLTNLATFLELHPDLAPRIERVIFLGGHEEGARLAFGPRNSFVVHDANVFKDPAAAARVMHSNIPLTLVPISTASKLRLQESDLRRLEGSGSHSAQYLAGHSKVWLWFWSRIVGEDGGAIFDVAAMLAATKPELVSIERQKASMNESGDLIVTRQKARDGRTVLVVTGMSERAKQIVLERLLR
jgi:inosine-uridine nucleoside N-ribohydrolase